MTIDPKQIPVPELHGHLLGAVAPRPIAFASTVDKDGKVNLSPFSFFNVFSANPPIMIFSPARRGRDNTTKHTLENVLEHPECTINIVSYDIVQQMSLSSTEYEKGVNEFKKAGFTEVKSERVKPPCVKEAPVSFECKVIEVKSHNINQKNTKRSLEYLAIKCTSNADETYNIKIFFAGDSIITIISESIEVFMHDLGKSWQVKHVPLHKI